MKRGRQPVPKEWKSMSDTFAAFGELMMRLSPPGKGQLWDAQTLSLTYGGAEANAAVAAARLGDTAALITVLPSNDLGEGALRTLRAYGVGTGKILRREGRIGICFTETGSNMRPSKVVYDRADSALAALETGDIDWEQMLEGVGWFHVTGITPALTAVLCKESLCALDLCREKGIRTSFDVNYRSSLWRWGKNAGEIVPAFAARADLLFAGVDDASLCLGRPFRREKGQPYAEQFAAFCAQVFAAYPNVRYVASGLRVSENADRNTWGGILCRRGAAKPFVSPQYEVTDIVDRIGVGDSYAGSLIYALRQGMDELSAVTFAAAASALKYTHYGDFTPVTRADVQALLNGDCGGRVRR